MRRGPVDPSQTWEGGGKARGLGDLSMNAGGHTLLRVLGTLQYPADPYPTTRDVGGVQQTTLGCWVPEIPLRMHDGYITEQWKNSKSRGLH